MASYTSTVTTGGASKPPGPIFKAQKFFGPGGLEPFIVTHFLDNIGKKLYFFYSMFFTASALMWPPGLALVLGVFIPNLFIITVESTKSIYQNNIIHKENL